MLKRKCNNKIETLVQKKLPLDNSISYHNSIARENVRSQQKKSDKVNLFEKNGIQDKILTSPQLYFLKVILVKDNDYINYLKYKIKLTVRNSKQRSQEFNETHSDSDKNDLTTDFVLKLLKKQNYRCAITNIPIMFAGDGFPLHLRASIDRIDNSKGYTKENIQLVSLPINHAKNKGTNTDILNLVNQIRMF